MDRIRLKGMRFVACHGVLDFEKVEKQPFIVDVEMYLDLKRAGESDELSKTVDYSLAYEVVKSVMYEKVYDLIETLAYRIGKSILSLDEKIAKVVITIHKPNAPIAADFEDVELKMEMDRDVLLLS